MQVNAHALEFVIGRALTADSVSTAHVKAGHEETDTESMKMKPGVWRVVHNAVVLAIIATVPVAPSAGTTGHTPIAFAANHAAPVSTGTR